MGRVVTNSPHPKKKLMSHAFFLLRVVATLPTRSAARALHHALTTRACLPFSKSSTCSRCSSYVVWTSFSVSASASRSSAREERSHEAGTHLASGSERAAGDAAWPALVSVGAMHRCAEGAGPLASGARAPSSSSRRVAQRSTPSRTCAKSARRAARTRAARRAHAWGPSCPTAASSLSSRESLHVSARVRRLLYSL